MYWLISVLGNFFLFLYICFGVKILNKKLFCLMFKLLFNIWSIVCNNVECVLLKVLNVFIKISVLSNFFVLIFFGICLVKLKKFLNLLFW